MIVRAVTLALLLIACHHEAPAAHPEPGETLPLPPSSGTPIGYLLDDTDLHLRDDQRTRLHEIDATLAGELERLAAMDRAAHAPAPGEAPSSPPSGRGGGRHGGRGGGGRGRRTRSSQAAAAAPDTNGAPKPEVGAAAQERTADVRDAIHRAFAVLDPDQQHLAAKVLADHDIDVDASGTHAPTEPATPETGAESEPGEP
jgi:hypothetical protein